MSSFSDPDTIVHNPMLANDLVQGTLTYSQELDNLGQQAQQLVAGSVDYFGGEGSEGHRQAMNLIQQAVQDGKDAINNHAQALDTAGVNLHATDHASYQAFIGM